MPIIITSPTVAATQEIEFDASGASFVIGGASNYGLTSLAFPTPPQDVLYASSVDTEGDIAKSRRYRNRQITIGLDALDPTGALLSDLEGQVAKIAREGGTLTWTQRSGLVIVFDLVTADSMDVEFTGADQKWDIAGMASVTLTFTARPIAYGTEVDLGDNTETTRAALIFTEASVPGTWDGLGRLVIDNDASSDWWGLTWGIETNKDYTFTDPTGSGALLYEAETRTALSGSATAAGPTGASGSGSNVMRNTALSTTYQAIMSTQASGGAHLTHVGTFRVWARVQVPTSNTGTVSVALEWGEGDFRRSTQNVTRVLEPAWRGTWRRVDLGLVTIEKTAQGTQRWEGRLLAKSTVAGDDIDVDWFPKLQPVDVASGVVGAVTRTAASTAFSARDEFDQGIGNLTATTLPIGGTWTFASGDTDDFTLDTTNHYAQRATTSDTAPRLIYAATPSLTNLVAQVDFQHPTPAVGGNLYAFIPFRWVNSTNYGYLLAANVGGSQTVTTLNIGKVVAGADTIISQTQVPTYFGAWKSIRVMAQADGKLFAWLTSQGGMFGVPDLQSSDSAFATGGTLASGKVGIGDYFSGASAITRQYDNFAAWVPAVDAAVYAGQSLEIRHSCIIREDSAGAVWQTPSSYAGDYLRVPVSGAEGRSVRLIASPLYNPEVDGVWLDDRIDDQSARLFVTPRYLVVPEP